MKNNGKYESTVKLLRYDNHITYANNIDNFYICLRCPSCETFFHKADHFNRHLLCFEDRLKNLHPRIVSTLKETFFEKTDEFKIESTMEQTLFKQVSLFLCLNQYALRGKEEKNNKNTIFDQEA